jgi:predicted dithiol-disulfide oxidoreductase (DUF899 family)
MSERAPTRAEDHEPDHVSSPPFPAHSQDNGSEQRGATMSLPPAVSEAEWRTARSRLLTKEKQATRALDALAAERRRLPMVRIEKKHEFEGPDGRASVVDLFDGRRQLVVYHFMFGPGSDPCTGCSSFADNIGHLAHLHARDTSFVLISRAPYQEILRFKARMGWTVPWFSSTTATSTTTCKSPAMMGRRSR